MTPKLRSFLLFFALPVTASIGACDCAGNTSVPPPTGDCVGVADGTACSGGVCCGGSCEAPDNTCQPGYECDDNPSCDDGVVECVCVPLPALGRGRMADELDSTVQENGTVVFAGYSPGDVEELDKYGDLVIGSYDGSGAVEWEIVDGVPAGEDVVGAIDGWRGGIKKPGDDVGRYPAIEANGDDLVVAYADVTNGSLKWAARVDDTWTTGEIDAEAGEIVSWASMALDGSGIPIVSYLVMKVQELPAVRPKSSLRIARPTTALPTGGTWTWNSYEIVAADMACHDGLCADGYACVTEGSCVVEDGTGDCDPACDGKICLNGACYQEMAATDHYAASGLYTDIELKPAGGFGLVYYDRTAGKLWARQCTDPCDDLADWTAPVLVDGFGSTRAGAGDCGIGASLFIDPTNAWHVTYVDGTSEELRYARLPNGTSPVYSLIDDGSAGLTGLTRPQISFVGDDSAVVVADVGTPEIRVAYADTTLHTTVLATSSNNGTSWTYEELAPSNDGEASFSVTQCAAGGAQTYVGSMWLHVANDDTDGLFLSDTDVFPNPPLTSGDGGL